MFCFGALGDEIELSVVRKRERKEKIKIKLVKFNTRKFRFGGQFKVFSLCGMLSAIAGRRVRQGACPSFGRRRCRATSSQFMGLMVGPIN